MTSTRFHQERDGAYRGTLLVISRFDAAPGMSHCDLPTINALLSQRQVAPPEMLDDMESYEGAGTVIHSILYRLIVYYKYRIRIKVNQRSLFC